MGRNFFYKKFVSRRADICMEDAGNTESAGKNTRNKNNYSYKKCVRGKRFDYPEHKVNGKSGENGSYKAEEKRYFKMLYQKGGCKDYDSLENIFKSSKGQYFGILTEPEVKGIHRCGDH